MIATKKAYLISNITTFKDENFFRRDFRRETLEERVNINFLYPVTGEVRYVELIYK